MNTDNSLARRALLALGLMIGFYVLALSIAGILLWIPYSVWVYLGRVQVKIAFVCIASGLTVVWAILPRIDRFIPPGPRLDEGSCPDLFRMIREVAAATNQEEPADVYVVNEVNAWVTHRGGIMGFGSRRVMGIGLPLIQGISQQELKAIIAHEFGHYSSGDVSLGPWIYKTRAAIGRAIQGVHESWLEAPFQWYGTMFLRITHGVSRQQEFIADQVAAKVAGAAVAASALRQVTGLAPAFSAYMGNELVPVMRAGFLPPVASGFNAFLKEERISKLASDVIEHAEREDDTDEFDTHPSLKQRLEALGQFGPTTVPARSDDAPAATLLPDAERHAMAAVRVAFGPESVEGLKPLSWAEVADCVLVPGWRSVATDYAKWLSSFTVDTLPRTREELIRAGSRLVHAGEEHVDANACIGRAVHVLGSGLGLLLIDAGWQASTGVGRPIVVTKGSESIDPFEVVHGLAKGEVRADEWSARCSVAGIAGRALSGGSGAAVGG